MKETTNVLGVEISNPNKIIFKKENITKLDVVYYYEKVSERMLPFLNERLLSVVRCHDGADSPCFFKKHPTTNRVGIKSVYIGKKIEENQYFYVSNKIGLINEVQLGTLEFHIWSSKAKNLNKPDIMTFDLDPDEGLGLEKVRQGVKHLKKILDQLGLQSFLKTSGGKGYHVVVPFTSSPNFEAFGDFAKQIAQVMESKWPNLYTTNIRKSERKGKIFIDWLRNTKGATSVAPYSLRNKNGGSVSMPIAWSALNKIAPQDIKLKDALKRIKLADPWKDFFKVNQKLGNK